MGLYVSDWLARLASQEPGQSAGTLTGNIQVYSYCIALLYWPCIYCKAPIKGLNLSDTQLCFS